MNEGKKSFMKIYHYPQSKIKLMMFMMTYACIFHPDFFSDIFLPVASPRLFRRIYFRLRLYAGESLLCVAFSIIYTLKAEGDSIWWQSWVVRLALLIYFVLILFSVFALPQPNKYSHKNWVGREGVRSWRDFVGKHIYISAFRPRFFGFLHHHIRVLYAVDGIKSRIACTAFHCESRLSESLNHNQ